MHERRPTLTTPPDTSHALVPVSETPSALALPDILRRAGQAAVFAAEEFFYGAIRNEHTRTAYRRAVDQFLAWCEQRGLELAAHRARRRGPILRRAAKERTQRRHAQAAPGGRAAFLRRHGDPARHHPEPGALGARRTLRSGRRQDPEITIEQARHLLKHIPLVKKTKREDGAEEEQPCLVGLARSRHAGHARLYRLPRGRRRQAEARRFLSRRRSVDAPLRRERRQVPRDPRPPRPGADDRRLHRGGRPAGRAQGRAALPGRAPQDRGAEGRGRSTSTTSAA